MLCMRSPCVTDTRWQGTLLELNLAFLMNLFFRDGEYCTVLYCTPVHRLFGRCLCVTCLSTPT